MSKRDSMLASIGSDLLPEAEPAAPQQQIRAVPEGPTGSSDPTAEGHASGQAELLAAREQLRETRKRLERLTQLEDAARDPDRYLIERYGIKGLRHGRPMTVRLPVHLDEGLDRYVGGSRVRTRTALVIALLDAYLEEAGLITSPTGGVGQPR